MRSNFFYKIEDNLTIVYNEKMSKVPFVPSPDVIAEINAVLGSMNLSNKISDRVCQTPRWRRAASATRWQSEPQIKLNEFLQVKCMEPNSNGS